MKADINKGLATIGVCVFRWILYVAHKRPNRSWLGYFGCFTHLGLKKGKKMDKCENCKFWKRWNLALRPHNRGDCHRFPPENIDEYKVTLQSDWCGEYKIGSNPVRDGKKPKLPQSIRFTDEDKAFVRGVCEELWRPIREKAERGEYLEKPVTKEDVPLNSSWIEYLGVKIENESNAEVLIKGSQIKIVESEEQAKIKAEINRRLDFICGDLARDGQKEDILKYMPSERQKIRELLEKL